jgi:hypothetical protein
MSDDLAATVAALKDGDRVRATFVDDDTLVIVEGPTYLHKRERMVAGYFLTYTDGSPQRTLTAVEVLAPALPPEPPVGSGVFHDGVLWVRCGFDKQSEWWAHGLGAYRTWAEIQPCVPAVPAERAVLSESMALPMPTDEPDVPVNSMAVFLMEDGIADPVYRWDNGKWGGKPWSYWTDKYGAPVAVIPAAKGAE